MWISRFTYLFNACGGNPGHCSVGQAVGAIGDGAYSVLTGVGDALNFVGRSIGLSGQDEVARSDQEVNIATDAAVESAKILYNSADARALAMKATEDAAKAYFDDELHRYYIGGRLVFGFATSLGPVAAIGDGAHALQQGHTAMDALVRSIVGKGGG
ncbi:MAG TPA: hypothetical protein VGV37_07110 [Aliidongia sp.]|uniref:hypothetical protein n=1 Tax=Aliidongia sp. TaxID=1914230 RepID=UPI002DDDB965|nr:hypothetical protein [Aliidongia sp.]HEV2674295.1 hypothetical protein [Aliidongia sp.]